MEILPNERLDDLQRKLPDGRSLQIIQNPQWFCFGVDAVLLSHFADVRKNDTVMDLGTGTGVMPLLLAAISEAKSIDGLEIQPDVADMARRSVRLNMLEDRVNIITGDIVGYKTSVQYSAVICNPPYKKAGSGILNKDDKQYISRHEVLCNLHDIVQTASHILKPFGRFAIIHRPERLADIIFEMRSLKIEPKRIRYVHSYAQKAAVMVMIEGMRGAKPYIKTEPPLVIYNEDGSYTDEVLEYYSTGI